MQFQRHGRSSEGVGNDLDVGGYTILAGPAQRLIKLAAGRDASGEPIVATKRVRYLGVPPRSHIIIGDLGIYAEKPLNQVARVVEHAPVERLIAHFKTWRIFHADYRRPYRTYHDAYDATHGLFFFSIIWGFE